LGWIYLSIFSIARVLGAILFIAVEQSSNPSTGLVEAAFILQSAALSPLMLATAGFLGVVSQGAKLATNQFPIQKGLHLVLIAALALAIVGGTDLTDPSSEKEGTTLRKVSSLLFLAVYVAFVLLHAYYWTQRQYIQLHRRTLLLAISCALPFLGARLIFSIGSAFSNFRTSVFSIQTGSVVLYGLLAVLPEFLVALTYVIVGLLLPLHNDVEVDAAGGIELGGYNNNQSYQGVRPQYAPPPQQYGAGQNNTNSYSPQTR